MYIGEGILIVWADIPAEIEDDYNEWYNREHMPDRILRMPGFLRGRRYVAVESASGGPKYLTYYDLQSASGRIARLRGLLLGQEDFCALLVRILGGCART